MRWRDPEIGDIRIRKKFLFKAMKINGEKRWLERAIWREKYIRSYSGIYPPYWEPLEWIN